MAASQITSLTRLGALARRNRWAAIFACLIVAGPLALVSGSANLTSGDSPAESAISVPEHEGVQSLDPNAMKDIHSASPASGVNLIAPPVANDTGDATLSYPIQVPPGRQGLQPRMDLSYDSGGGNGWVGLGWDLAVPTVTVDTRWGVPRYDSGNETESYQLSGQPLTPLAHRGPVQPRAAERVFHTRVESGFAKIVRHGTLPANYWWEVTDKKGLRYFYGGVPETGQDSTATLADAGGHVFKWGLREIRDLHGNSVTYTWDRQSDPGVPGGSVTGFELYPRSARYTNGPGAAGRYLVTFVRDRELPGWVRRPDITIDGRNGALRVVADLLRRVDVAQDGTVVRSYDLAYREGAFGKMLLASVTQRGEQGVVFNTHTFDYYDDARAVNNQYRFGPAASWNTGADNLGTGTFNQGHPSALGGSVTTSIGGHLYVGVNVAVGTKMLSGGGKVGYTYSTTDEVLALVDIDGDTLPDKVFRRSDGFYFRPNRSGPSGVTVFGEARRIPSLSAIGAENASTVSFGAEAYLVANGLANHADTFTSGTTYFRDVNGDGLADLVSGEQVLFNRVVDGLPTFGTDSSVTPAPVPDATVNAGQISPDLSAVYNQMLAKNPPHDTLRRWVAPYSGQIKITGAVTLVNADRQGYQTADGVRVAIQHNATELYSTTINGDDFAAKTPTGVDAVDVTAGDRIYFRVQTRLDGAFDQVSWDPRIAYVGAPTSLDVNHQPHHQYQASTDFALTGRPGTTVNMPFAGTVRVAGALHKLATTTDDLAVQILHNGSVVLNQAVSRSTVGDVNISHDLTVAKDDTVELRVRVDSPIAAQQVTWAPQLYYLTAPPNQQVVDANGRPVIQLYPPYSVDVYPVDNLTGPQAPVVVGEAGDGEVTVTAIPNISAAAGTNADVVMTVKRRGELLAKVPVHIVDGVAQPTSVPLTFELGEELFFDYSNRDPQVTAALTNHTVTLSFGFFGIPVPAVLHSAAPREVFAPSYRRWSYVGYNGAGDRATQPVNEALLVADDTFDPSSYDPTTATAYPFTVFPAEGSWRGPAGCSVSSPPLGGGALTPEYCRTRASWVTGTQMSSARAGAPHVPLPTEGMAAGRGVSRFSTSSQNALGGGVGFLSGSVSDGSSAGEVDFLDLNGDGFPDAVGNGKVIYSGPDGSLAANAQQPGLGGDVRGNDDSATNLGIGGNPASFFANSRGDVDTNAKGQAKGNNSGSQMGSYGFALNASLGSGTSVGTSELLDVNGDSLPDLVTRVVENGAVRLRVALNLGYGFTAPQPWGSAEINDGSSSNSSLGGGFNDGIYSFGGGASVSSSESASHRTLLDINGDGKLDRLTASGTKLRVGLNTGDGFAPDVDWFGALADNVGTNRTFSLAGGVYFTIGIGPLCLAGCYVIINPGGDVSQTVSRPGASVRDVNGDSFPDAVTSDSDGSLTVAASPIARTNLLRTVSRPLGATMSLDYERSGNTYAQPESHFVLSRLVVHDGHAGDGVDQRLTTYRYEGGRFERFEREFYGYRTVVEEQRSPAAGEPLYRQVVREYANDSFYTKGLLTRETTRDHTGKLFAETIQAYELRDVGTGAAANPQDRLATVFPQLVRTDRNFYEGAAAPGVTTSTTYAYDSLGDITSTVDTGDAGAADDLHTTLSYLDCPATYLHQPVAMSATADGKVLRRREASIDCATGDVTQVRAYLDGGAAAVTDLTYQPNGNIASVTNPPNKAGQRYALSYEYDAAVQTYVTKVTDNIGHVSTSEWNVTYGQVTRSVDANGSVTTHAYDGFGRLVAVRGPYEQSTALPTISFEYHPEAADPWAASRRLDSFRSATDTVDEVIFVDGLGRQIQTKRDATIHTGDATAAQDRMVVSGKVVYDLAGRAVDTYYPVDEPLGQAGVFNTGVDSVAPTHTDYDVLDRKTLVRLPDNTTTSYAYGFRPDRSGAVRQMTTTTDASLRVRQTFADVRGRQTSAREVHNGQPLWTSFGHDPLGQLLTMSDANGNTTTVEYDALGRKVSVDSPDAGKTVKAYDLASNVVEKTTTALGGALAKVTYDYSFTRLTKINYPTFPGNNVTYTYGPPGAPDNQAGRVTLVADGSGSKQLSYGKLGETTREVKTIASDTGDTPEVYATQFVHDSFGRLQNMTYADGELVTYGYDSGGLPRTVVGAKQGFSYPYVQRMEYDKFRQRVFLLDGNGVKTNLAYRADNRRLASIATVKGARKYQNLLYGYDPLGNLTSLVNDIPVPPPNEFGGPSSQTFSYDDLYRLVGATGQYTHSGGLKTDKYTLAMAYDNIHNIVSKQQTHDVVSPSGEVNPVHGTTYSYGYAYGGPHPHAPTKVGDLSYSYDPSGCQVGWVDDTNANRRDSVFDEDGRIRSITTNGQEIAYKYDDSGNRVVKRGPAGETAYVNQYLTIRDRQVAQKDIYVGSTRLATKLAKQDKPGGGGGTANPYEKDLFHYHPDHQGSSRDVTDPLGQLFQHTEFFPYGETWVKEKSNIEWTPNMFTGKELDEETGLYYFGARYYDPRTSQFVSTDPAYAAGPEPALDNGASVNLYGYGANNPMRFVDPEGADVDDSLRQYANGDRSRADTGETGRLRLPGLPTWVPPVARYNLSVGYNGPLLTHDPGPPTGSLRLDVGSSLSPLLIGSASGSGTFAEGQYSLSGSFRVAAPPVAVAAGSWQLSSSEGFSVQAHYVGPQFLFFGLQPKIFDPAATPPPGLPAPLTSVPSGGQFGTTDYFSAGPVSFGYTYLSAHVPVGSSLGNASYRGFSIGYSPSPSLVTYDPAHPPIAVPGAEQILYGHSTGTDPFKYGHYVGIQFFGTLPLEF
ncbi:MAG TPA: SpvB/TcaC N-terminal domain-containing protein [Micromonosporaceae bacterium]|nr:SpvB/TcaC N-terminal domain-containing protein [Micromonosporaceae bacterium]